MLTEADRELIAAALDGELAPAEEAVFRRLLADSVEAGVLFRQLQAQARRLRSLPPVPAPAELTARVIVKVRQLPKANPAPTPRPVPVRPSRRVGWLPFAVAASALLAVSAGSFWLARHSATQAESVAQQGALPRQPDRDVAQDTGSPAVPPESAPELIPAPRRPITPVAPAPGPQRFAAATPETAPLPRPAGDGDVIASGQLTEARPFDSVQVRLPFLAPVVDLDKADVRSRVLDELGGDSAYRLDLFAKDLHAAADAFQAAARGAGVKVTVEKATHEWLRKKVPTPGWVVYTESLTPDGVAKLLTQLAVRTRAEKAPSFTTAHLYPALSADHRDVRDLIGAVAPWKRPDAPTRDPKSIATGTADQVTAAVQKSGKGEKTALFLTYLPPSARSGQRQSREAVTFVEHLGPRKPDVVPLFVVIRPVN